MSRKEVEEIFDNHAKKLRLSFTAKVIEQNDCHYYGIYLDNEDEIEDAMQNYIKDKIGSTIRITIIMEELE